MNRSTIVHRTEDIERLLKRGLAPITDNAVVLQQMGLARAYPTARNGYEASMYELRRLGLSLHRRRFASRVDLSASISSAQMIRAVMLLRRW
jgi:hypothetical protein